MSPAVVEVTSRTAFYELDVRLWARGLDEDTDDGVICRWPHRVAGSVLYAIPSDSRILSLRTRG
jgi:hypothetical protein